MATELVEIKGEMLLLGVLHLASADVDLIRQGLQGKRDSLPHLFANSPLVVDGSQLGEACQQLDMVRLRETIQELGFIPIGIRGLDEARSAQAVEAGWALLRAGRGASTPVRAERSSANESEAPVRAGDSVKVVDRPVRSGQQVYFPDGNVVVLQHTSAGSEILAGGSVHVYGSLRGRVLAGILGDVSARIFCQKLEAELVAIAGHYRLLDDIDTDLKGSPAMVWLENGKLKIAPIF
ncbi:septum site-determining protein MinC [Candidatus Thiothrix sp. Deng01]|uniref:Probable septum site-determining protein MinC n=1 Tax=Candidatus Thiothrix phosphatis TaxID=3112415 RepID=A0ABU6CZW4_9GAMM|nr:septum site-determining protein MinC [Candidatus Thiothrix sp. Deng01]MEB4592116.1 septum site-determining protein MinC [Candidatus Thiothrix sp. Deng01]